MNSENRNRRPSRKPKSVWRIEYTNHPWLKKKRKKILERAITESIEEIKHLLKINESDGLMLGDTDFSIESTWLPNLKKHHIAVCDLKKADDWVATIVFEEYPTMSIQEVKRTLKKKGFREYSLYALGITENDRTVAEYIAKLQEKLSSDDEKDEWVRKVDLVNLTFLEHCLEQGIIKLSDRLLDALRKIDREIQDSGD